MAPVVRGPSAHRSARVRWSAVLRRPERPPVLGWAPVVRRPSAVDRPPTATARVTTVGRPASARASAPPGPAIADLRGPIGSADRRGPACRPSGRRPSAYGDRPPYSDRSSSERPRTDRPAYGGRDDRPRATVRAPTVRPTAAGTTVRRASVRVRTVRPTAAGTTVRRATVRGRTGRTVRPTATRTIVRRPSAPAATGRRPAGRRPATVRGRTGRAPGAATVRPRTTVGPRPATVGTPAHGAAASAVRGGQQRSARRRQASDASAAGRARRGAGDPRGRRVRATSIVRCAGDCGR